MFLFLAPLNLTKSQALYNLKWPPLKVQGFIMGLGLWEAIKKKQSKYGHCPNWLNPPAPPPLFWALAEHFLCVNRNILLNPTKQHKF